MRLNTNACILFALIASLHVAPLSAEDYPKSSLEAVDLQKGIFELPPLPYAYSALEPYIEEKIMDVHHNRHHKTYVENLNKAVKGTEWEGKTLLTLFQSASKLPAAIRNNAGGHWNHSFYWVIMTGDAPKKEMSPRLEKELIQNFGSVDKFKEEFRNSGLDRFGDGYVWLVRDSNGALKIGSTPYQDNPLMDNASLQGTPLLVCDVWEHAYYLQYLNKRGDYLNAFWNVINWQKVDELAFLKK